MRTPTKEQCLALLKKHGFVENAREGDLIDMVLEAYRAGMNADVMRVVHKQGVKNE